MTRFRSLILDVDSTLSGIEGIDWLAERRGPLVARAVAELTEKAMSGEVKLEDVFEARLTLVHPTRADIDALAIAYIDAVAPGASEAVASLMLAGVRIVLVSGGIRRAILPLAGMVGIAADAVHAVEVLFDSDGEFMSHDRSSPLILHDGKRAVVESLVLPRPCAAVGDGMTDVAIRPVVDCFIAFTGFTQRGDVVKSADETVESFEALHKAVLR